jgi:RND family efflux transporter MFP subunit
MNKKPVVAILFAIIILVGGLWIYRFREAEERMNASVQEIQPVMVSVVPITRKDVTEVVFASGTVRAVRREYCYFQTAGRVTYVKQIPDAPDSTKMRDLKEGDRVKKGELLAYLDPRQLEEEIVVYKSKVEEEEARYRKALVDADRYEKLWNKKAVSQAKYEEYQPNKATSKASLDSVKAQLHNAEVDLEHSKIIAPADGIIAYMNVKTGIYYGNSPNYSSESEMLNNIPFVILKDNEMELEARVPSFWAELMKPGLDARIMIYSLLEEAAKEGKRNREIKVIPAKVYSVNPAIDPGGRSLLVKIRTTAEKGRLRDGQYVSSWIVTKRANNALSIPYNAILFEDRKEYCFVVTKDKEGQDIAERRFIETGIGGEGIAQVLTGLKEGDLVVVDGKHLLVSGSLISIQKTVTEEKVNVLK